MGYNQNVGVHVPAYWHPENPYVLKHMITEGEHVNKVGLHASTNIFGANHDTLMFGGRYGK